MGNRFAAIILAINMEVNSLDIDLTLQLTVQSPFPKAIPGSTDLSCTPDTPLRKKSRRIQTCKQVQYSAYIYINIFVRLLALTAFISIDSSLRLKFGGGRGQPLGALKTIGALKMKQ